MPVLYLLCLASRQSTARKTYIVGSEKEISVMHNDEGKQISRWYTDLHIDFSSLCSPKFIVSKFPVIILLWWTELLKMQVAVYWDIICSHKKASQLWIHPKGIMDGLVVMSRAMKTACLSIPRVLRTYSSRSPCGEAED
ncbi:hypothetical protein NOR_08761 [Metarhizium rileyi]|uniref:Uncharacterized protein n=1 Tax=Metarhizium rileyi (strain RCEF 4871) TaxID=1649241 RepID=A0A166RTF9_METRR|nr:hypothetical protein NOR_08761 [Metarhizium rileyi RCEF 4871]